jgi:hypothetical protein
VNAPAVRAGSRSVVAPAFVAGMIGAAVVDAFLSIATHRPIVKMWQFIASTAVGPVAFSSPEYALLGGFLHLVTSLVWAYLYAYVWRAVNNLRNWGLGAVLWGVVVNVCMDGFLALRGALPPLMPAGIIGGLVAHIVFFAIPVAWYLARSIRSA